LTNQYLISATYKVEVIQDPYKPKSNLLNNF